MNTAPNRPKDRLLEQRLAAQHLLNPSPTHRLKGRLISIIVALALAAVIMVMQRVLDPMPMTLEVLVMALVILFIAVDHNEDDNV